MASTDAKHIPVKNAALRITFPIFDADGDLVSGATGLDSEVSIDGAAFADCTNEATEIGSTGMYYLDLTSGEMNGDTITVIVKTSSSGAKTTPLVFYPAARNINDLAFPTTTGRSIDVTATGGVGVDWANVENPTATLNLSGTTIKTATDVETDTADIQTRLPAALVGGRIDSDVGAISGDATASDNLETMLDGTGGNELSLGKLDINGIGTPVVIHSTGGGGHGVKISSTDDAAIFITPPAGNSGVIISGGNVGINIASTAYDIFADIQGNLSGTVGGIAGTIQTLDAIWVKIKKWLQLGFRKDSAIATDNATEVSEINANGGSGAGAFANTTDSQEAIRDRGDAAWTGGGSSPHLLVTTTITGLISQQLFSLTAGSPDDNAYNGCLVIITDASDPTQQCVAVGLAYAGTGKLLSLLNDPGIFTIADGDTISILADRSLHPDIDNTVIDIDPASGNVGIDWGNIVNKTTTNDLSATSVLADITKISGDSTAADKLEALLDTFETGTAQAGAAGSITLASGAAANNDYYERALVIIYEGTGIGQGRVIDDYSGSTKIATVLPIWTVNPDNTSKYIILPWAVWRQSDIRDAMKLAPSAGAAASGSVDDLLADILALITTSAIGDAAWDEVIEGSFTARQMLRAIAGVLAGKVSGGGTVSPVFRNMSDTKNVVSATVDASGNRTAQTYDLT